MNKFVTLSPWETPLQERLVDMGGWGWVKGYLGVSKTNQALVYIDASMDIEQYVHWTS